MKISSESKNTFTTLIFAISVAIIIGGSFHLIGYFFPAAHTHFAPNMSLNLGTFEMFEPMLSGLLTIFFGFAAYLILPACVIGLVASFLYKLGEFGQWMFKKI